MSARQRSAAELDVDVRFLLANERTLLAWIRTGLTVLAGGAAVAFIYINSLMGTVVGISTILFGGVLTWIGYLRYRQADTAIRNGELPDTGRDGLFVVIAVIVFAIALVAIRAFA